MRAKNAQQSHLRALSFVLLPILLNGIASSYLIVSTLSKQLDAQTSQFGQAIAVHMAISVADHLASDDRLSLNVLLAELLRSDNFDFASVYNTSNELLAQAGKRQEPMRMFTKQVTSQDAIMGYLQLGFDQTIISSQIQKVLYLSIGVHFGLAFLLAMLAIVYGDLAYLWIMQSTHRRKDKTQKLKDEPETLEPIIEPEPALDISEVSMLALKIRPSRLLPRYNERIKATLALYNGQLEHYENGDILVYFNKSDQLFQAICAGLLILAIFRRVDAPITIKAGLHQVKDRNITGDFDKARKHTSYLASISDNQLLVSRSTHELIQASPQYNCQAFHGSMAPDGEVFCIDGLTNQALIESQAKQIC